MKSDSSDVPSNDGTSGHKKNLSNINVGRLTGLIQRKTATKGSANTEHENAEGYGKGHQGDQNNNNHVEENYEKRGEAATAVKPGRFSEQIGSRLEAMRITMVRRREKARNLERKPITHEEEDFTDRRLSRKVRNSVTSRMSVEFDTLDGRMESFGSSKSQSAKETVSKPLFDKREDVQKRKSCPAPSKSKPQNQLINGVGTRGTAMGYMQLRAANVLPDIREGTLSEIEKSLASMLLATTAKENFCDSEIVSCDGVSVRAPSFLLATHSPVLEEILYPKDERTSSNFSSFSSNDDSSINDGLKESLQSASLVYSSSNRRKVYIKFAKVSVIKAVIHHCATLSLPSDLESDTTESNIRSMAQLYFFAKIFRIKSLISQSYNTARSLMNKVPSLVCAAFDEINVVWKMAESEGWWGLQPVKKMQDDLKAYAMDYLRDSPSNTVLDGGVQMLSSISIEAILKDQDMDVDEETMFHILNAWVHGGNLTENPEPNEERIEIGKKMASHIKLSFLDQDLLRHLVKNCGFVDDADVDGALEEIEWILAHQSPDEKEHVVVENAGIDSVNGLYVLFDDDIGLGCNEVMFVKEAGKEEDSADYGLYHWKGSWYICSCVDYSNVLYSCDLPENTKSTQKPPKWGWKSVSGAEPPPMCTWNPSKDDVKLSRARRGLAPTLEELKDDGVGNRVTSSCKNQDHAKRNSLSLTEMLDLPVDDDFVDNYASMAKSLRTMMNLPVDDGYTDEEGGYDCHGMSGVVDFNSSARGPTNKRASL